jgi:hypothetical protein
MREHTRRILGNSLHRFYSEENVLICLEDTVWYWTLSFLRPMRHNRQPSTSDVLSDVTLRTL